MPSGECLWQSICRVQALHKNDLEQHLHPGLWKAEGSGDGPAGLSVGIKAQIEQWGLKSPASPPIQAQVNTVIILRFPDEETEAQRGPVTSPGAPSH